MVIRRLITIKINLREWKIPKVEGDNYMRQTITLNKSKTGKGKSKKSDIMVKSNPQLEKKEDTKDSRFDTIVVKGKK
jgi:hypothetical protein